MANIKLTPEELLAQSAELASIQAEFQSLFTQVTGSLNSLNDNWSEALAGNFAGKIAAVQKSFASVADMMANGAAAARVGANTFTEPGAVLALLCGGMDSIKTPSQILSWLEGDEAKDLIVGQLSKLTGVDLDTANKILENVSNGNYEEAIQLAGEKGIDVVAGLMSGELSPDSWVGQLEELTGGKLGLGGLEKAYYKNLFGNTAENAVNIVKDMYFGEGDPEYALKQLGEMAWNIGPGAVIETGSDAAFNVVKNIPVIGDYYTDKGVTDGEGAISSMIGDLTYMITGDSETAAADANYYQAHGGIASGIVDGVIDIGSYVSEQIGSAWHSMFGE